MAARTRPLIGINLDYYNAYRGNPAYARLNAGYMDAIWNAGGMPIPLPPFAKEADFEDLFERLAGVVLTGGLDMDPKRANQPTCQAVVPMAQRREENDRALIQRILEKKLPTLGIGLGMQMVNNILGGTLFLHLPSDQPKALPHFDPTGGPHRHIVMIEPKTLLEDIYGPGELRVNSDHHQAVNHVGRRLKVCAKSPDGIIEAIESTDPNWFFIGVQWHPESETATALDMQIFECFVLAAERNMQPLALVA